MLMIKEYWNITGQKPFLALTWELELDFLDNFHFTQIPDKTNDIIFLKSPKTMFWGHFWPFLPDRDFFQKIQLCHTQLYMDP